VAAISTLAVLAISYQYYVKKNSLAKADNELTGWEALSNKKLFIDELYDSLFVKPIEWLSEKGYRFFEIILLNGVVANIAKGFDAAGGVVRKWQSGQVNWYVFWMVSGIVGLIVYYLLKF
jgi:NADH-quinone oxidoreductase subunit L